MVGTNTTKILAQLDTHIDIYKPSMVISMMGINDKGVKYYKNIANTKSQLFNRFKTYKLTKLLWKHVVGKFKEYEKYSSNNKKVVYAALPNEQHERITKEFIRFNPSSSSYFMLGVDCLFQYKLFQAEKAFKKAIEKRSDK